MQTSYATIRFSKLVKIINKSVELPHGRSEPLINLHTTNFAITMQYAYDLIYFLRLFN